MNILGAKIRKKRKMLDMTQKDLGGKVGLSYKIISQIERGKRGLHVGEIDNFSKALQVPRSWFVEEDEPAKYLKENHDESNDNFSGLGTDIRSTMTETDNVDVLLREVSKMSPEQRQKFWDGILKIVEVVVQTRFKQESKSKDKTVLVLE
jgi:transcriptional regulator with XRE-family HTH domain